jgi:hypothetical protein
LWSSPTMHRNAQGMSSSSKSNFSLWMEEKQRLTEEGEGEEGEQMSYFGRLFNIQEEMASQMEGLSGSLPDAGPMSAAFRSRMKQAVYLLIAATFFAAMAVLVGIPTLILKPSKFVTCVSISTICTIAAIAIMQKPEVFIKSIFKNGLQTALPIICMVTSLIGTIFIVVFHRSYLLTIFALCVQTLSMLWFLASFVPGGSKGLQVILRMGYLLIKTAMTPMIFVCRKATLTFIARLIS